MAFSIFINFSGDCTEALELYSKAFGVEYENPMTYSDAPPDPENPVSDGDKARIMYAQMNIEGTMVMFCDMPQSAPLTKGNSISPTVSFETREKTERVFRALSEGGTVDMDLQRTFFCEFYGMVTDKFGITWHIMYMGER